MKSIVSKLLSSIGLATNSGVEAQIDAAIDDVVKREGDDWFVVLEDSESKKFVQYTVRENSEFYFDLPSQVLSEQELSRAKKVLSVYEIEHESRDILDKPNGAVVGKHGGFSKNIGSDNSLAKTLAKEVFFEIYQLDPNFKLTVLIER